MGRAADRATRAEAPDPFRLRNFSNIHPTIRNAGNGTQLCAGKKIAVTKQAAKTAALSATRKLRLSASVCCPSIVNLSPFRILPMNIQQQRDRQLVAEIKKLRYRMHVQVPHQAG